MIAVSGGHTPWLLLCPPPIEGLDDPCVHHRHALLILTALDTGGAERDDRRRD